MQNTVLFALALILIFLISCTYNKEEELYPPPSACDPGTVTFSGTIQGILTSYTCNFCHGSIAPSGNISLVTYNNVKVVVNNGKLLGAITHAPGFSPMPQAGGKMNACDIAKVKAWIDAGALDN